MESSFLDAVYFYNGILEAYEIVGQELIGPNVMKEHAIPRMVYYVKNFLAKLYVDKKEDELKTELESFILDLKNRIENSETSNVSIEDIWQLRAAIFGYESSFLDILGDNVIKNYVLKRIPEILAVYLPEVFANRDLDLNSKLDNFAKYLKSQNFVKYANFSLKNDKVSFSVNKCAFSSIHDSDAYKDKKTRFCPWGMMVLAIVNDHQEKEFPISSSIFVTHGTITEFDII